MDQWRARWRFYARVHHEVPLMSLKSNLVQVVRPLEHGGAFLKDTQLRQHFFALFALFFSRWRQGTRYSKKRV